MRRPRRSRPLGALVAVAFGALLLGACVADPPVTPVADEIIPPTTLVSQGPLFHDKQIMVRFRTTQCGAVVVGSGFAIGPHTIITNRHVVAAGGNQIAAETWEGRALHVTKAVVSPDVDLAEVTVSETLPVTAKLASDTPPGHSTVLTVGYPLGKQLKIASGEFIELEDGDVFDTGFQVLLTSAAVQHGNSGGPLVDVNGTVVGVVFALAVGSDNGIAIPVNVVNKVLSTKDFIPNYTCDNVPPGILI